MYKVRSENGYGFLRPGLKMGVGNGIFWSQIGSGLEDASGTLPPKMFLYGSKLIPKAIKFEDFSTGQPGR